MEVNDEAELKERFPRKMGRLSSLHEVDELGSGDAGGDLADHLPVLGRFDKKEIGSDALSLVGAEDRFLESRCRDRIRASHNQKVGIGAGVDGGAELAEVVAPWGELLPAHMAAAFGVVLVLEEQPLGAGADERACGLDDVKS